MNEVVRSFARVLRSNFRYVWILCLLLAGLPFLAAAQEATIVGTVTDPAGSVVPNVTITVTNTGTGYVRYVYHERCRSVCGSRFADRQI